MTRTFPLVRLHWRLNQHSALYKLVSRTALCSHCLLREPPVCSGLSCAAWRQRGHAPPLFVLSRPPPAASSLSRSFSVLPPRSGMKSTNLCQCCVSAPSHVRVYLSVESEFWDKTVCSAAADMLVAAKTNSPRLLRVLKFSISLIFSP